MNSEGDVEKMLVFLDTEFTDLKEPYLISAALIAADGRELYFELDGVNPVTCSSFVIKNVLPLLQGPTLSPFEAATQVEHFFRGVTDTITLFCDAPRYDIELLKPFLPAKLRWQIGVPSFTTEEQEDRYHLLYETAFNGKLKRHHALDDARALRDAWNAVANGKRFDE
jgi:hypothetical protein